MKKKYIFHIAYTSDISKEISQGGDFMTERQIISWIAQAEDVQIDVTQHIVKQRKDLIRSTFKESLIF
jgi:hypothetical protein